MALRSQCMSEKLRAQCNGCVTYTAMDKCQYSLKPLYHRSLKTLSSCLKQSQTMFDAGGLASGDPRSLGPIRDTTLTADPLLPPRSRMPTISGPWHQTSPGTRAGALDPTPFPTGSYPAQARRLPHHALPGPPQPCCVSSPSKCKYDKAVKFSDCRHPIL